MCLRECDKYKEYAWRVPIILPGPPSHHEIMHDRYWERRRPLEDALLRKLRSGELVASALQMPPTITSRREWIPADLWEVLELDFEKSEAAGPGIRLLRVEILERSATAGTERSEPEQQAAPRSQHQGATTVAAEQPEFGHSPNYSQVTIRGLHFQLGAAQANIVRQLHEAAQSANPWVPGKRLLDGAQARTQRLSDLFKKKTDPSWRELIKSDGRGAYRLHLKRQSKP